MSEDEALEKFVKDLEEVEVQMCRPSDDWQDWIPKKLRPSTMMGLAMTKHFINTPADERV